MKQLKDNGIKELIRLTKNELKNKANINHNHDNAYSKLNHTHSNYSLTTHNHDSVYSKLNHIHSYAASSHNHDDRYYTESEVNSLLSNKQNISTVYPSEIDYKMMWLKLYRGYRDMNYNLFGDHDSKCNFVINHYETIEIFEGSIGIPAKYVPWCPYNIYFDLSPSGCKAQIRIEAHTTNGWENRFECKVSGSTWVPSVRTFIDNFDPGPTVEIWINGGFSDNRLIYGLRYRVIGADVLHSVGNGTFTCNEDAVNKILKI